MSESVTPLSDVDTTLPGSSNGVGRYLDEVRAPREVAGRHVVQFDHVSKTYNPGKANQFTAIRDITFAVEDKSGKGEFISVLGPSGCGKSTILRLIAGLEPQHPPTQGTVRVMGRLVTGPGPDRGMVFQDYTSFDHQTVLENVTFGLKCLGLPRRLRRDLGREWIERVGLRVKEDQDKYPHELSGGMRQRVAIARTLILRPRIILMDEPFGALDPQTRALMQDLLVRLWRDVEATVFFVTHSISEAVYLGDRVYVLSRSPGTLLREMEVEPPDRPPWEMEKESRFQHTVAEIRDLIRHLEEAPGEDPSDQALRKDESEQTLRKDQSDQALRKDESEQTLRKDQPDQALRKDESDPVGETP